MKIVLIGGNPKGFKIPFHPDTLSGNRLRNIISKTGLDCEIIDMTNNVNDSPTKEEIEYLKKHYENHKVVFLGRFVERALRDVFPNGKYLPHPASRRKSDLIHLEEGLRRLCHSSLSRVNSSPKEVN